MRVAVPGLVVVVFVLGLALVVAVAVIGFLAAKRRREEFAALAARQGWQYVARDDRWADSFEGAPFGRGHGRHATNVLSGSFDGRPFVAFDFVYHTTETSTDAQGHTTSREESHRFSVAALDAGAAFPPLEVSPEGFMGRMVGRLTGRDIELESEDFNRAFTVTCPDRKFASDVLHPRMMDYLLGHPDVAFRFQGRWLLAVHAGSQPVLEVSQRLGELDAVLDQVPEFVWREVRG